MRIQFVPVPLVMLITWCGPVTGQSLTPELKSRIEAKVKQVQGWGVDPVVVSAVRAHNTQPPPEAKSMSNEKWKSLTLLDPLVRSLSSNSVGQFLKAHKDGQITECFVSGADGTKVGFLSKPTYWSHSDKDKHRIPMSGKNWTGQPELDESTGKTQIQVGIPVLDGGRPIGSIVVGLDVGAFQ